MEIVLFTTMSSCQDKMDLMEYMKQLRRNIGILECEELHFALNQNNIRHVYFHTNEELAKLSSAYEIKMIVSSTIQSCSIGLHALMRSCAINFEKVVCISQVCDFKFMVQPVSYGDRKRLGMKLLQKLIDMDREYMLRHEKGDNVLVIGSGGREHAIIEQLRDSKRVHAVYVTSSAPMDNVIYVGGDVDFVKFGKEHDIELCVIGPEAPLIDGLADTLNENGIPTFGPSKEAAVLEASKAFSKDFMKRHDIDTASYENFTNYEKAIEYVENVQHDIVVKASGIAAGKGVILPENKKMAKEAVKSIMKEDSFGEAGHEIVIEERMVGPEVSVLAFCDGNTIVTMPGAQDHKRIKDMDVGPNTGGMGAYAPAPCLTKDLEECTKQVIQKVITKMKQEGKPYVGVLYAGFMLTKDGPKVLEFNCRFGDPETQVLLPLLDSDLYEIMKACVEGRLEQNMVQWKNEFATTIVAASEGYPGKYPKGKTITGVDTVNNTDNVHVFQAGTILNGEKELTTNGGRVLAVTGTGKTLDEAVQLAYNGISKINFQGMQYRKDIALQGLLHDKPTVKLAVLGSTRGTSMQPIIDSVQSKALNASIEVVISNKSSSGILERAQTHGLKAVHLDGKGKSREDFDREISTILEKHNVDIILLIGYMRILSADFCKQWNNKVLNVHPSLLPDFAGGMDLAVHQAVLDAKKSVSGCTTHFVTEDVDGGPIAVQLECPVMENDTAETLKARVQPMEGGAFLHSIRMMQAKRLPTKSIAKSITYADAGVSIDAGNALVEAIKPLCKATRRPGCDSDLGGFGGLFDLSAAGYTKDTVLVACTDGVGTKLKVAQLCGIHDTVGIDLVAMCVNDLIVQGAEPLLFLDYYACGQLTVSEAKDVVKGISDGCVQSNCGLIGGETAEMPSMYTDGDYDLAGFCIGAVQKCNLLPKQVNVGDVLIGIPSSGLHSNGYSLVRKLIELNDIKYSDPCPYDPSAKSLGHSLLTPTRIYVKQLFPHLPSLNALAHITGGGLLENIPRILPKDVSVDIDCTSWTMPPVYNWLRKLGNLSDFELSRTFNCGVGMVLILPSTNVDKIISAIPSAFIMGNVIPKNESQVNVHGNFQ